MAKTEAWHHGADSVSHLHGNNLASPLFLVAKGVTTVVLGPLGPDGTQVGVNVADSVLEVRGDDALQLTVIHRLCGSDVGADFKIFDHIGTFFKTTYMDSTARGVRSNCSCGNSKSALALNLYSRRSMLNREPVQPRYQAQAQ